MTSLQRYKKQGIYIFIGLLALLFPYFDISYFVIVFLGCALFFSVVSPESPIFNTLARECDIKARKLTGLSQLFFTMTFLLVLGLVLGDNKFPLFIIGAAFAITTFGDGVADVINIHEKTKLQDNHHNDFKFYSPKSSIVFLISGSVFAVLAGGWISGFTLQVPYGMIIFLAVIGAITGALLETMTETEDNIIIPFGSAMVMWLFYTFSYNVDTVYLMEILVFSFVLGYLAYRARIADISAMLSATLLGVVIIVSSGLSWFFILLAFFLLGGLFTRYKYNYKLALGIAEGKGGVRGYKNVFSNSLAALSLAITYGIYPSHGLVILAAYLGSVATATGDTLASEIGETCKGEPRMITTLKKVRAGADGAVSFLGEGAAFFGSLVIALLAFVLIKNDFGLIVAVTAGGFIGTNIDSVLGATLQQKGYLSNNGVNLFATISGAIISGMLYYSMGS
ncbi:MAG: TIGR00297 family protein [Candidatus Methanoperedens sp.]